MPRIILINQNVSLHLGNAPNVLAPPWKPNKLDTNQEIPLLDIQCPEYRFVIRPYQCLQMHSMTL